ncbi:hypothetical protein vseg_009583 [Gypsophila vaccaria]
MQVLIATSRMTSQMNMSITKHLAQTKVLPKSFLPGFRPKLRSWVIHSKVQVPRNAISASLLENPIIWAARVCVFYALLKAGVAGSHSSPLVSGAAGITDASDLVFSKWFDKLRNNPEKEAADKRKLVSKWNPTTKGTLRRNYRIHSKPEGRRLLKAIAALLSDDDHFVDASSHKGCQIRRESAHGESVCCNNVRALFDELPTPHIIVEITPFPAGPLSEKDYAKAEKLERVLRSSPSV